MPGFNTSPKMLSGVDLDGRLSIKKKTASTKNSWMVDSMGKSARENQGKSKKIMENHGKNHGQLWKNHGKNHGKS